MAESESGRGEFVQDGRIEIGVVIWAETWFEWIEAEFLHLVPADDDWQPFVVGDVLQFSNYNSPGLLVKTLVVPMRIEAGETLRESIVLSQKDSVRNGHIGIHGMSVISCTSLNIYFIYNCFFLLYFM